MKPKRIIVTRDFDGDIRIWPGNAILRLGAGDNWHCDGQDVPCGAMWGREFKSVFGFAPRKGTKKVYDITEVEE